MREIKFRAFNTDLNKMIYPDERGWYKRAFIYPKTGVIQHTQLDAIVSGKWKELVPMQYTGLKDKNGQEIFENDVVKGYWWRKGEKHRFIGRVTYVMSGFRVRGVKKYFGMDQDLDPTYEVIGNIHENPELVEATK